MQGLEPLLVQALVPELAVEALDVAGDAGLGLPDEPDDLFFGDLFNRIPAILNGD